MQTKNFFWRIFGLSVLLALLFSACQVNIKTNIDKNGAGSYIQEIGFQGDEASFSGLNVIGVVVFLVLRRRKAQTDSIDDGKNQGTGYSNE